MSQFRPDQSIIKAGLLGSSPQMGSVIPRNEARGVLMEKETEGKGKRKRERVYMQGERKCREMGRERPKCLHYIGKSFSGKGSPAPQLESSGQRAGMPAIPCNREGLRDAGRT